MIKVLILFLALGCRSGLAREVTQGDLDAIFLDPVAKGQIMGVSVGLYQKDKTTTFHYGKTSATGSVANDQTKYEIASITKIFTGTLMGFALNEGLIRESDLAQAFLTDLKLPNKAGVEISILDLLTHRSGFDNSFWGRIEILDPLRPWKQFDRRALENYLENEPLVFIPGSNSSYDNIGVGLAGLILQKVYGVSYDEIAARLILSPLKMENSGFYHSDIVDPMLAKSHLLKDGKLVEIPAWHQLSYIPGMGGMHSTMEDMLKFTKGTLKGQDKKLNSALRTAMKLRLPSLTFPNEMLGLLWRYRPELNAFWHNGSTYGMNSFIAINPRNQTSLVLLCNTGLGDALTMVGFHLAQILDSPSRNGIYDSKKLSHAPPRH